MLIFVLAWDQTMNDIDNIFDIFAYQPQKQKTYSVFTGAPNQITKPAQTNQDNVSSAVQAALARNPLWFAGSVNSDISPVVELSQYWPLQILTANLNSSTKLATEVHVFTPPKNKHWLMMSMILSSFQLFNSAAEYGLSIGLWTGDLTLPNTATLIPDAPFIGANAALISGRVVNVLSAIPYYEYGLKPIYVGNGNSLIVNFAAVNTGNLFTISTSYYELPENQPFGMQIACAG